MRHLRSILYALVLAPAAWILCGVGFDQDLTGRARDNGGPESVGGLLLLLLAGAAYAILLFAPISPAGPLIAGLVLLGVGIWARVAPDSYAGVWPADVTKDGFNVSTPGYGLALLLAVPLLSTALSARRWAGYEPPQVVFIGTLGRARGAATAPGTTLAAEPTTAFNAGAGDETTLLSALFPAAEARSPGGAAPSESRSPGGATRPSAEHSDEPTHDVAGSEEPTRDVAKSDEPTRDVAKSEEVTTVISAPVGDPGEKTQVIRPVPASSPSPASPAAASPSAATPSAASPSAASSAGGSNPGEATTKAMSISGAERPDPGQDPTTRLTPVPPASPPGEATTRASKTSTVAHLERPADEAADDTRPLTLPAPRPDDEGSDDTRPLTLPAPRPPADDEVTRRL